MNELTFFVALLFVEFCAKARSTSATSSSSGRMGRALSFVAAATGWDIILSSFVATV